jgi:hypothetical protein
MVLSSSDDAVAVVLYLLSSGDLTLPSLYDRRSSDCSLEFPRDLELAEGDLLSLLSLLLCLSRLQDE